MKKPLVLPTTIFIISGCISVSSVKETQKPVKDELKAIAIAVEEWQRIYGKKQIAGEKPYHAIQVGEVWVVHGSLPPQTVGGVSWAVISKKDGTVLGTTHTR